MSVPLFLLSRRWLLLGCLLLVVAISFGQKKAVHHGESHHRSHKTSNLSARYGIASFYARKFVGRRTASGEIYEDTLLTAACNVLPLGTWIRVTNLKNHRNVIVKVNDRLNSRNNRLVDLSRTAARRLGFIGRGLTRVRVEVVPAPSGVVDSPKKSHYKDSH